MQIRLSVLAARDSAASARTHAHHPQPPAHCADVLVTAPVGTTLGAVAGALAGAVGARPGPRGGRSGAQVQLYVGDQRLDERAVLGHPPLVDGAVLRLDEPDPDQVAGLDSPDSRAELRVVGGPDAGGIHLLHPGRIRVGRSADADVPLDDPDVSRFHLTLDVSTDGRVTLADLGSTNGTRLDGVPVGPEPGPLLPGALVSLGESALMITRGPERGSERERRRHGDLLQPDGQGRLQVPPQQTGGALGRSLPDGPGGPTASGTGSSPLGKPVDRRNRSLLARGGDRLRRGLSAPPGGATSAAAAVPAQGATPPHGVRLPAARPPKGLDPDRWPDPAEVLHTALGPGPRLWERGPEHRDALSLRLGGTGPGLSPVVLELGAVGSLGLSGPRPRLHGLARSLVAQLAVLHGPSVLEIVLIAADPSRPAEARAEDWAWLHWLPQLRPTHGQACRLLTALDPEQALARLDELGTAGSAGAIAGSVGGAPRTGAFTVLVVDGDPGSAEARTALEQLIAHGAERGVHALLLAEHPDLLPAGCGALGAVTGEVETLLALDRPDHPRLEGIALDAVSAVWAERLARALAPLREPDSTRRPGRGALPDAPRLLDLLGLDLVTPAKLSGRWAELQVGSGTLPTAVVGSDREGACGLDIGHHLLVGGAPGSGRTELLRGLLAALCVAERPDRLGIVLIEGRPGADPAAGLRPCTELPHVTDHVDGTDPLRLLQTAQALLDELDRRESLLAGRSFASWHAERALARLAAPRRPVDDHRADLRDARPEAGRLVVDTAPPAQLLVAVDDHDELLLPGRERAALAAALDAVAVRGPRLGVQLAVTTGRPDRSSGTDLDEAAQLRIALRSDDPRLSALLIHVDDAASVPEDRPGRGFVRHQDGGVTALQTARISGRIPRTATLRPTVAPLDWTTMGDPPPRRPVRELGNGPTDLALLASALQRAAETLDAAAAAPLLR